MKYTFTVHKMRSLPKLDAKFARAWEDPFSQKFSFIFKTETTPTEEQLEQLKALGANHIAGAIFTAHELNRESVQKMVALDFVKYLQLSVPIHPENE